MCHDGLTTLGQRDSRSLCLLKGKILYMEQETCNAEDRFAKHFTVATVKAEIISLVTFLTNFCFVSTIFQYHRVHFQLCFSSVTSPPTPHIWACAPISHV